MAKKPTAANFRKMVFNKAGNITEVAKGFKVSRKTIYDWAEEDAEFKEAIEEEREADLDFTESQMKRMIKGVPKIEDVVVNQETGETQKQFTGWVERPDTTLMIFKLKTKGKARGYVEKSELDLGAQDSFLKLLQETSNDENDV